MTRRPHGERAIGRKEARARLVHGVRWPVFALLATLAIGQPRLALAEPTAGEVEAAMIFNITRFVEWPAAAFGSPSSPLVVAIIGQDEVGDVLETMLRRKSVNGHPLEVRHVRSVDDARKCHVLYVAISEKRHAETILEATRGTSTLTVAELDHFAERGGHINLVLEDRRMHILVNPTSVEDSHLKISARLLSLARLVGATP